MSKLPDGALKVVFALDVLDGVPEEEIDLFVDAVSTRINKFKGTMFGTRLTKVELTTRNVSELGSI